MSKKPMRRSEARELVMKIIFQMDIQKDRSDDLMNQLINDLSLIDGKEEDLGGINDIATEKAYIKGTFKVIRDNLDSIDSTIDNYLEKWTISRIPKVDLAIIRVAVGEIIYIDDIPESVSINEAVNLAKKYGSDNSPKVINGLLGKLVNESKK